ncbi:DUF427 domain-containing protein [Tateyamaria sp. ANG-S1]|uniref:DUF427 domain-containing protein n=1 Tax=Tateyamaria sp. ANG-S1 TaxID=1577905 RepID=UPI00057F50FC|nr:DUF427 domain-containing protein [Tateyamaria sp. ANG-S1]KIC51358.1 hypothetical protein RA29_05935 [Tateyamaria sp. ANG-S1]
MTQSPPLVFENVQDYPRPPALEAVPQGITVVLNSKVIVDTCNALRVLETHHAPTYYIPPDDISAQLVPVEGSSYCEWKGIARYFDVIADGRVAELAAWSYDKPSSAFSRLAGYVAFYANRMDVCTVGAEVVRPQPGDFYGGWQTSNLTGIVKGGPGTRHW